MAQMQELRNELEAIASCELADILDAWNSWNPEQLERLKRYLRAELEGYGMLSLEKARDNGQSLAVERRQARRVLGL